MVYPIGGMYESKVSEMFTIACSVIHYVYFGGIVQSQVSEIIHYVYFGGIVQCQVWSVIH